MRMDQSVRKLGSKSILLIAILGAAFQAIPLFGEQGNSTQEQTGSRDTGGAVSGSGLLRQISGALEDVVAKVSPAVVQIQASGLGPVENNDGVALIVRQHAIGSGVIVDPDGFIITNAHVIEGAQRIRVVLPQSKGHYRLSGRASDPVTSQSDGLFIHASARRGAAAADIAGLQSDLNQRTH